MAKQPKLTPQPDEKSSTLKMSLKGDSGFRSTSTQRITLNQWQAIHIILAADPSVRRGIYDQHDNRVGEAFTPVEEMLTIGGYVDDKGTVWTPPTAYAYYAVCQAVLKKDARILELLGEKAA